MFRSSVFVSPLLLLLFMLHVRRVSEIAIEIEMEMGIERVSCTLH